jgi:hypothetical protein
MSIFSYPDRGKWGKSSWRGNCSGYFYKDLFGQLKPSSFCDPMVGSGTSIEVATEMGIKAFGLDLHSGFNILRQSIANTNGELVDLCVSHPPYGDMIVYSGAVWGKAHADDLSRCSGIEDFYEKMTVALINQRDSVRPGGHYGTLIGDQRKQGEYISFQAELIARMPSRELKAVLIKAQHNVLSSVRNYNAMQYPRIQHEYLMLWQRPERPVFLLAVMANQAHTRVKAAWKAVVRCALISLGGKSSLKELYAKVAEGWPEKVNVNANFEAKIRQTLQSFPWFQHVDRGVWALAA